MSDTSADDRIAFVHSELERLASEVRSGGVSLADLAITKQLTKNPADYADKKALPHVQVGNLLVSRIKLNNPGSSRNNSNLVTHKIISLIYE